MINFIFFKGETPPSDDEAAAMISEYDIDGDGSLQFDEFSLMMDRKRSETQDSLTLAETEPKFVGRLMLFGLHLLHVAIALYFCIYHQAGTESATNFIARHIHHRGVSKFASDVLPSSLEVHYLAPCHAFPGMSALHHPSDAVQNIIIRSPDCSPGYDPTESKLFEIDPVLFYSEKLSINPISEWNVAEYIVTFDTYAGRLEDLLVSSRATTTDRQQKMPAFKYKMIKSYFHSHFRYDMDDPHHKRKVYIYQRLQ